jgi:hypothetical protein
MPAMGAEGWIWITAGSLVAGVVLALWQWINSAKPPPANLRCVNCARYARQVRALSVFLIFAGGAAVVMSVWVAVLMLPAQAPPP